MSTLPPPPPHEALYDEDTQLFAVDDELDLQLALLGEPDVGLSVSVAADEDVALSALAGLTLLPPETKQRLAENARQGEIRPGSYLFREHDPAQSFFVVLYGTVAIVRHVEGREVLMSEVGPGEAIGLLELFSGAQRTADARAVGEALVLEVSSQALNEVVREDEALRDRVLRSYRHRLLQVFVNRSPYFPELHAFGADQVIARFEEKSLREGENLAQPGEVGSMVALVLEGNLHLEHRRTAGEPPHHYELYPGQFVALTSGLSGQPRRLRVFAATDAKVLLLQNRDLAELVRAHPSLKALPARLAANARTIERDVYCGTTGIPGL